MLRKYVILIWHAFRKEGKHLVPSQCYLIC